MGAFLRDIGQKLDKMGVEMNYNNLMKLTTSRHRTVMSLENSIPVIGSGSFIAPNASIVGEVLISPSCSVWHNVVLRGDFNCI